MPLIPTFLFIESLISLIHFQKSVTFDKYFLIVLNTTVNTRNFTNKYEGVFWPNACGAARALSKLFQHYYMGMRLKCLRVKPA
jgi:hypothetical protein